MASHRWYRSPLMARIAALVALACALSTASLATTAYAEVKTYSPDDQLSLDVYSSLGLATSELDEETARETAPYDASELDSTTTLLTMDDVYVAANGRHDNTYTLRSRLNRLDDDKRGTGVHDNFGNMVGAYNFYGTSASKDNASDGHRTDGALSDNANDVVRSATHYGFSGKYATSVAVDLGSGWDDHVAELRAYGSDTSSYMGYGTSYRGGITIRLFSLDEAGNRTLETYLMPTVNDSQLWYDTAAKGAAARAKYLNAGYLQENDAVFEIEAADVDNDHVDEIFCYTGAYEDRDSTRYAIVDMFDIDPEAKDVSHSTTELDAGPSNLYVTNRELQDSAGRKDDRWYRQLLKQSPVVTLAAGNLDLHGGEEVAMTVSAPGSHDNVAKVGKCYVFTWDGATSSLRGVDGLNDEVGGPYVPLYNTNQTGGNQNQGMASANCAFGTFQVPGSSGTVKTTTALIVAGWDRTGSTDISKDDHYTQAAYRYVYYDPASDRFVVSGYLTKGLGKDAEHIVYTATHDSVNDRRYVPTLAPFALCCARLQGLHQNVENDQVLFGGEIYDFVLGSGVTSGIGSIAMCSNQQNNNSNTKTKEQVWIGDVVAGNVSGSTSYEESFLAVIGIHRDDGLGNDDDYYWMDIAHFTAKYHGEGSIEYKTAQEGVICEGNRVNDRYGTWVSLCLPNVSHRGMQVRYKDMAKYYTAPQVLAMLEDAPYFKDLQQSFRYIVLGGTGFERGEASGSGHSTTLDFALGAYLSAEVEVLGSMDFDAELKGTFSVESQHLRTVEYGVSYESHAGEGNKVVVYTVPMIYYAYEVSDPTNPDGKWSSLIVPICLEPVTALVSEEAWDEAAGALGLPKVGDVLANASGEPSTYTAGAMQKLPTSSRAFTSRQTTATNNSRGATITQSISTEQEEEMTIGGGMALGVKAGGGLGFLGNKATAGVVFDFSAGWGSVTSSSRGFTFEGAVDNLPEEARDYGFSWKLAVNKSHREMPTDGTKPSENQFWIIGYEVSDVTRPAVGAVSGLSATASTDSSVTLSWDDVLEAGGSYNYGIGMLNGNGQLSDWRVVPAGTTSYVWEGLSPSRGYSFVIAAVTGTTEGSARAAGIRSATLSASTLPAGHALALEGADIKDPAATDDVTTRQAKRPMGSSLTLTERASYAIAGDGSSTYVEPKFVWYRKDPRSGTWTAVGHGSDVRYGSLAGSDLDAYLQAKPTETSEPTTYVSTLTIPSVTAAYDGSEWRCDVSRNDMVVSSHVVSLDVTHTVVNAPAEQVISSRQARRTYLTPGTAQGFSPVTSEGRMGEGSSSSPTVVPTPATRTFPDVDYGAWYAGGVEFCATRGVISGYADGRFGVGDPLTRGQFATILWRIDEPEAAAAYDMTNAQNQTGLADVSSNAFYTGAANWAVENGVILGYGNSDGSRTFGPDDPLTPEQLAAILARYVGGDDVAKADQSVLDSLTDSADISDWALQSMAWFKSTGLIEGYENADGSRTLRPQENIARERAATIIMRAYEKGLLG